MFPFIPHNKVYHAIEILKGYSQTVKFSKYFSQTYLDRYDINEWSAFNKMHQSTVTNNMVERHNRRLNDLFNHSHPSLKESQIKLSNLENEYYNMYNNSDECDENIIKHYSEDDFDKEFNFLQNYLQNHCTRISSLPEPPKEFKNTIPNDFTNIKYLPEQTIRNLLIPSLKQYFKAPERSMQRRRILEETVKQINNPNINLRKIRLWFNNNRDKYESYEAYDDHLQPINVEEEMEYNDEED